MKSKETVPICIRLPKEWILSLRERARRDSYESKKDINYHDLIREAIAKNYKEIKQ